MGFGVIGLHAQDPLEVANGLLKTPFPDQQSGQVIACLGVIRFQAEGFLVLADRLVDLAFLAEGAAEVVVGVGVIRFQAEGFPVLALIASSVWPFLSRASPKALCAR